MNDLNYENGDSREMCISIYNNYDNFVDYVELSKVNRAC